MEQKETHDRPPGGGPSRSNVETIVALVVFFIGVVMVVDNYRLGAGWATDGPQSGYFPLRIGVILCIAAIFVFRKSLFGKNRDHDPFVTWPEFKRVLQVLLPTMAYVLAIQFLGIYVASAIFIGGFMRVMDKSSWLYVLSVGVGVSAMLFWLFEIQFKVPLPKGPLEAMLGY